MWSISLLLRRKRDLTASNSTLLLACQRNGQCLKSALTCLSRPPAIDQANDRTETPRLHYSGRFIFRKNAL
jgi:hypothetical protein